MGTVQTVDRLSFNRPGLPTSASCWPPWIQGCALESRPAAPTSPGPQGIASCWPGVCRRSPNVCRRLHTFTQCLPTSAYVHPMFADVCIMLARSALITRWNSNQVPWDPSRELHRVPARSSNQSRPPWNRLRKLHRVPAHGSLDGTPTRSPGIHGCAYFRPMDPWLCIESRPGVCRRSPNVCRRLHTSGPVGVDHSMELQPGPLGSIEGTASSPGPQGIASCWPGRR
jgi:hypothetical protein